MASHLLYTQPGVLRDRVFLERIQGINAGHRWMTACDKVVVYCDRGISTGMKRGVEFARKINKPVEQRWLDKKNQAACMFALDDNPNWV